MIVKPVDDRVFVKLIKRKEKSKGGIFVPSTAIENEGMRLAEVLAIGEGRVLKDGTRIKVEVSVGDKVLIGEFSGDSTEIGDEEFIVLKDIEILAIVDDIDKVG